jgi:RNA polymerase sigma-70 factor (ECF subfamily)
MMANTDPWQDWLEEHGAALLLFARQHVRSLADAEDVLQEAFVRFWRSRHRARDPLAYLYACVRRMAMDFRRGEQRRQRRESAVARPADEAWFDVDAAERREAIERALAGLPIEQRETLVMKTWGGATFRQIGEALGLSPKTAASRYRDALDVIRTTLTEDLV